MSFDDACRGTLRRPDTDHPPRLAALIGTLDPDELRLLTLLVERIVSRRPRSGQLEVAVPRDAAGDVAAAVELAVDLALATTQALTWARRQQT